MSRTPITVLRKESEASHLIRDSDIKEKTPMAILEIQPLEQTHISLGEYTHGQTLLGFSVEVSPDYEPDNVIVQITQLGATFDEYELVMHVANYQNTTIIAEVFRI